MLQPRQFRPPEVERIVARHREEDAAREPRLFHGSGTARSYDPPANVKEGVRRYANQRHLNYSEEGLDTLQVDPVRGHAQYLAYRDAQRSGVESPQARPSYEAMREEVTRQYDFMTKAEHLGGMGLRHEVTDEDPYPTPAAMAEDVGTHRRIRTFSTQATGGHEFFTDEENDKFRAVHDVFGHAALGRGFSRHGEEAAYLAHAQFFPPAARAALTSETRGQNSYLNYGPKPEFPNQGPGSKLVTLPEWASERGPIPEQRRTRKRQPPYEQLKLF